MGRRNDEEKEEKRRDSINSSFPFPSFFSKFYDTPLVFRDLFPPILGNSLVPSKRKTICILSFFVKKRQGKF